MHQSLLTATVARMFMAISVNAQSVKGAITIGKSQELNKEMKSDIIIELFVEFKNAKYPILFSLQGENLMSKEGREIILFGFVTEDYFNGNLPGK